MLFRSNVIPDWSGNPAVIVIVGTGFPLATTLNAFAIPSINVAVLGLVIVGAELRCLFLCPKSNPLNVSTITTRRSGRRVMICVSFLILWKRYRRFSRPGGRLGSQPSRRAQSLIILQPDQSFWTDVRSTWAPRQRLVAEALDSPLG